MESHRQKFNRRRLLGGAAAGSLMAILPEPVLAAAAGPVLPTAASPLPLKAVRLKPSPYLTAVEANRKYLLSLSADRFLHNYHKFSGLPVKGEIYGGWESDTIAGEGLGHYLSALALMHAQTGDGECKQRIDYIIGELVKVQAAQGDGYAAGIMRRRKDRSMVDGKEIFAELKAGQIYSGGFDLNGAWSPLYSIHKVFAGLLDAHELAGNTQALAVAVAFGGYIEKLFAGLTDEQTEALLKCEYGGLNESFAEMYARTRDARWLHLAERIYDHQNLDAIVAGRDALANTHSNTQIPKVIGLARISELDPGKSQYAAGARFFWETVTHHHSFVIGGNGDREYFFEPDSVAKHVTEQTCEHCCSYNMLKLTRQLFAWEPDGRLFDYYERTHINHVLAAQNPATGMFTYMTPMMSGSGRDFSSPENDFWCCVLSGMESHAKHGDSIYWQSGDVLFVNLYIPSTVDWGGQGAKLSLDTKYPYESRIGLKLDALAKPRTFSIALRIPAWSNGARIAVNGKPVEAKRERGYAIVRRTWKKGDTIALELPLDLRLESAVGDDKLVSVLRGPLVLAADLGPYDKPFDGYAPAMVGDNVVAGLAAVAPADAVYQASSVVRPNALTFKPFYSQVDRRTALYFRRYSEGEWATVQAAYIADQKRLKDLAERSLDVMHLGEMQPERDHNFRGENSNPVIYRGRSGRDARKGGYMEFEMKSGRDGKKVGPLVLGVTYWGSETGRDFNILIDGTIIAHVVLKEPKPDEWVDLEYPIPAKLTAGKAKITVKFDPQNGKTAGPVFGVRLYTAASI
jgi:DUF1680 family protein